MNTWLSAKYYSRKPGVHFLLTVQFLHIRVDSWYASILRLNLLHILILNDEEPWKYHKSCRTSLQRCQKHLERGRYKA